MPNSNPIQTQIKLKTIEVSKRVYNVVRSIVESSTKPTYEWNKPIRVSDNVVKFVKYKVLPNNVEVKAWEIVIQPLVIQKEGLKLTGTIVIVYDGLNNEVADLTIRDEFTLSELDVKEPNRFAIAVGDYIIGAKSIHEYEYYFVSPSDPVPYTKPISLAAFVNKLTFYYAKAMQVVKNADAKENDKI